ncbi:MAG: type II toxin-antitoxin system HicB family antitoxin [Candidatus Doudnabacteria bacterium]|nr:type II toxin-antitoxin system HicB family antitoxin [Candidatus Doudnabacteria bacterium]
MLTEYIIKKLKIAKYKLLKDGSYFGSIPGIQGVWANAKTLEACRTELQGVLEDWLVLQLRDRRKIFGLETKAFKITSRRKQYA